MPSPPHPGSNETAPSTAAGALGDPAPQATATTKPPQNVRERTTNVGPLAPPTTSCAEGTTHYLRDRDGDGYAGSEYECASGGPGLIALKGAQWDCDDNNPELQVWVRRDENGDGFGHEPASCVATVTEGTTVEERLHCDDTDAAIHPDAVDFPEPPCSGPSTSSSNRKSSNAKATKVPSGRFSRPTRQNDTNSPDISAASWAIGVG